MREKFVTMRVVKHQQHQVQLVFNAKEMEIMENSISTSSSKHRNEKLGGVGHSPLLDDPSSTLKSVFVFT